MFFMKLTFSALILFIICEAKKQAHWTDFVPNRKFENEDQTPKPNDSHNSLNLESKANKWYLEQIKDEIPVGHTNRYNLIPLIDQRDKQEEKVNNILIGGIIARKLDHKASHCLFNCAFEERTKSQHIQRQIDQVKSEGHIDERVERAILNRRRYYTQARHERVERYKRKFEKISKSNQRYNSNEVKSLQENRERRKSRNERNRQLKRMKRQRP